MSIKHLIDKFYREAELAIVFKIIKTDDKSQWNAPKPNLVSMLTVRFNGYQGIGLIVRSGIFADLHNANFQKF